MLYLLRICSPHVDQQRNWHQPSAKLSYNLTSHQNSQHLAIRFIFRRMYFVPTRLSPLIVFFAHALDQAKCYLTSLRSPPFFTDGHGLTLKQVLPPPLLKPHHKLILHHPASFVCNPLPTPFPPHVYESLTCFLSGKKPTHDSGRFQ